MMEPLRAAFEIDKLVTEMEQTADAIALLAIHTTIRVRARELRIIAEYLRGSGDLPEPSRSSHYS